MQTGTPAALSGLAQSITRGNWFDCTPTKPTRPKPPASLICLAMRSGRMRVLVSSRAKISTSTSSPSAPVSIAFLAMP